MNKAEQNLIKRIEKLENEYSKARLQLLAEGDVLRKLLPLEDIEDWETTTSSEGILFVNETTKEELEFPAAVDMLDCK